MVSFWQHFYNNNFFHFLFVHIIEFKLISIHIWVWGGCVTCNSLECCDDTMRLTACARHKTNSLVQHCATLPTHYMNLAACSTRVRTDHSLLLFCCAQYIYVLLVEHYIYCYCAANFVWHAINKQINWALNCLDAVYSLPRNYFSAKATEFFFFFNCCCCFYWGYCGGLRNNTLYINAAQNLLNWIAG